MQFKNPPKYCDAIDCPIYATNMPNLEKEPARRDKFCRALAK